MYGRKYTPEQIEFLIANVPGHSYREIMQLFQERFGIQLTLNQIKSFIGNRKLNTGRTGRFKPGHVPFNKGKKGISYEGMEATQFKKGHKPWNCRPVGSERVTTKDGYLEVKVADPNKWRGKHILIWEAANGPVPKGHVVIFGDGNKRNFDINNLLLVSRAQLVRLNQNKLIQNDIELTKTGIIIADIHNKIGERKKKQDLKGAK